MKTILLKKINRPLFFIFVILSITFFFSCKKSTQTTTAVQPAAPQEFVNFTIDNMDTSFVELTDNMVYHGGSAENEQFNPSIAVVAIHHQGVDSNFVAINFSKSGIAAGSSQRLSMLLHTGFNVLGSTISPLYVNITEYGNVGQYVAGNFSGQLTDMAGINHTVSADFRILRNY